MRTSHLDNRSDEPRGQPSMYTYPKGVHMFWSACATYHPDKMKSGADSRYCILISVLRANGPVADTLAFLRFTSSDNNKRFSEDISSIHPLCHFQSNLPRTLERTTFDLNDIQSKTETWLQGTRYASKSITPLSGGTVNFTFLVDLSEPLEDGTEQVVVKHGEPFVGHTPSYKVSLARIVRDFNFDPMSTFTSSLVS